MNAMFSNMYFYGFVIQTKWRRFDFTIPTWISIGKRKKKRESDFIREKLAFELRLCVHLNVTMRLKMIHQ